MKADTSRLADSGNNGVRGGLIATGAMSLVLLAADAAGLMDRQPPGKLVDKFLPALPSRLRSIAAIAAHFTYGATAGAVCARLPKVLPGPFMGTAFGFALWAAGYEGWLPALGVIPPAHKDKTGRALTMLTAHLVYGAALGRYLQRSASAAPAPPADGAGLPLTSADTLGGAGGRLPESYVKYLADKDTGFVAAVLPVLEQSAAGGEHGVHVRYVPGGVQALVEASVPYPEVTEGVD